MKHVFVSNRAIAPLISFLMEQDLKLHLLDGSGNFVDQRIKTHADLMMCQIGLAKDARIFAGGRSRPEATYPGDAVYNAAATGRYFIHNTRITDPDLLAHALSKGLEVVFVRQGYSRCNCLPVDDTSFITSDEGIAKALDEAGASVLRIQPGHVLLPGFPSGFFGGCAGNLYLDGRSLLIFNGDLTQHPDFENIAAFSRDRDVELVYFEGYPLEDIGSVLFAYDN